MKLNGTSMSTQANAQKGSFEFNRRRVLLCHRIESLTKQYQLVIFLLAGFCTYFFYCCYLFWLLSNLNGTSMQLHVYPHNKKNQLSYFYKINIFHIEKSIFIKINNHTWKKRCERMQLEFSILVWLTDFISWSGKYF